MHYEITAALSKRKCHFCSKEILKKELHFRMHYWKERVEFPTIKNVCAACAQRFYDPEWIKFLEELIKKAKELESMARPIIKTPEPDKTLRFICERCLEPKVEWNEVFGQFQCKGCNELFETYDLARLELIK